MPFLRLNYSQFGRKIHIGTDHSISLFWYKEREICDILESRSDMTDL